MRMQTLLAGALLVAGCSTTVVREEPRRIAAAPKAEIETALLAEALLAHERGTSAEALEVSWKDKAFSAEMVVKGDGERLTIVLLAPQMRLATLTLTKPHRIEWERAPKVPSSLAPEYALADVAFARLPAQALAAALGAEYSVQDDGKRRVVSHGGREIRVLERLDGKSLVFSNPMAGYSCRIVPMEAE